MKKLVRLLFLVAIIGGGVGYFLYWSTNQEAAKHYEIAENRIREGVAENKVQLSFRDLNQLSQLPDSIVEMQNLEILSLRDTRVENLESLAELPNLNNLDIGNSWVADLEPLTKNRSLNRLDIGGLQLLSLEPVTRIENLSWINLHKAYALDGSKQHYETLHEPNRTVINAGTETSSGVLTTEVFNGNAFKQNYVPGQSYLNQVKLERIKARLGLTEVSAKN